MTNLNADQFKVFEQMGEMDEDYPDPAAAKAAKSGIFYHGTTHDIKDVVRPADVAGRNVSEWSMGDPGYLSEGDHAFAIRNHENYAWHAAMNFHKNGRRPRVYEVEPAADMRPGPWNKDHPDFLYHHDLDDPKDVDPEQDPLRHRLVSEDAEKARKEQHQDEWASPTGFKVKQRIDIAPGHQGTFPEVNWNRFKDLETYGHPRVGPDMNHPSDEHVQYGVRGHEATQAKAEAMNGNISRTQFGHDWRADPAPHSPLREAAGRPQKRWATLLD